MLNKTIFAVSAIALLVAMPNMAYAKSIKQLVSKASLQQFCSTVGIGSETTATVTLPDGTKVTGTIHCEAEDVAGGGDNHGGATEPGDDHGNDGPHGDGHHSGKGNGGLDNSGSGGNDDDQGDNGHHGDGDSGHHGDGDSGHHGDDDGDHSGHGGHGGDDAGGDD